MHQTLPNRIIAALRSLSNVNIKHIFVNSTDFSCTVKAHMESKTIKLRRIDRFPQFRAHNIQKRLEKRGLVERFEGKWNGRSRRRSYRRERVQLSHVRCRPHLQQRRRSSGTSYCDKQNRSSLNFTSIVSLLELQPCAFMAGLRFSSAYDVSNADRPNWKLVAPWNRMYNMIRLVLCKRKNVSISGYCGSQTTSSQIQTQ